MENQKINIGGGYRPIIEECAKFVVRGYHETGHFEIPFGRYEKKAIDFAKRKVAEGYSVEVILTISDVIDFNAKAEQFNSPSADFFEEDEC